MFATITIESKSDEIMKKVLGCIGRGLRAKDGRLKFQSSKSAFRIAQEIEDQTGLRTEVGPNMIIVSD